jgi:CBS domain-containing protein
MAVECVSKKCPNCNITISDEMKFCGNCGAKLKFKNGEIFNHVLNLERENRIQIAYVNYITALPNSSLMGIITLADMRSVPFIGNKIIERIGGRSIKYTNKIFFRSDEILTGIISLYDNKDAIFVGDNIIETIKGKKIESFSDEIYMSPNGDLAGAVRISDGRLLPFNGDFLMEEINGKLIMAVYNVHLRRDGKLAGRLMMPENIIQWFPFIGEIVIKEIENKPILTCDGIDSLEDNTLIGWVHCFDRFSNIETIFIGDKLLTHIGGIKINRIYEFQYLSNGVFAGIANLQDGREIPFIKDTLLEKIGGKEVNKTNYFHLLPNGNLIGVVTFYDGKAGIFLNDKLIYEKIDDQELDEFDYPYKLHILPDGRFTGAICIGNRSNLKYTYKLYQFVGDQIYKYLEGFEITQIRDIDVLPNGEIIGSVILSDGSKIIFKGNKIIEPESIVGEKVESAHVRYLPDGTLEIFVDLLTGRRVNLFWYETQFKITEIKP